MNGPKIAFEMRKVRLPLDSLILVRQIKDPEKTVPRYKAIRASIKEVGLVEPLIIFPHKEVPGKFQLLNGHLRYFALKELGETSADCIVATDDECFTYNARVSRLPPIQEHKMIVKAINNGVSAEQIAAALNMPHRVIVASIRLLNGIHDEAADLLKDKNISAKALQLLKRVSGVRQIEMAEFMVSANNYSVGYAEALVLGTSKDQLVDKGGQKKKVGMSVEDVAKMQQEMESLERDVKSVSENYTENMFNLTCARGYIKKLLDNAKVAKFLNANFSDILSEFEAIAAAETV